MVRSDEGMPAVAALPLTPWFSNTLPIWVDNDAVLTLSKDPGSGLFRAFRASAAIGLSW
jgi:hypothetical protein